MTRIRLRTLLTALLGILALSPCAMRLGAQDENDDPPGVTRRGGDDSELSNCNVPSEPTATRLIGAAEKAVGEKNWKAAVRNFQEVLTRYPEFVYEMKTGYFQGNRRYCSDRLRALPPEGRAAYREAYESRAAGRFEEAMRCVDRRGLRAVADNFPLSSWADRASGVLGSLYLEEGAVRAAVPCLERACASDLPEIASAWFLPLASAYTKLGDKQALERLQAKFLQVMGDKTLLAGGNPVDIERTIRDWAARIPTPAEVAVPTAARTAWDRWECLGGDAGRSRLMLPSLDLPPRMWGSTIPTGSTPHLFQHEYVGQTYSPLGEEPFCYFPVVADGIVYLHNDVQVYAFDLLPSNASGRKLWTYPKTLTKMNPTDVILEEHAIHTSTLADGRLFVNLAWTRREAERQLEWLDVKLPLPNRALIGLDAQTGSLLWRLGGLRGSEHESFADQASFAEAPAVAGNGLFLGAVFQANDTNPIEHYLCKVDARTGELLWKTNVCSGFLEMNLFNNPTRESVGTPVTLWRDTALYCSNMGIVASVDQSTGRIRWLKRYKQHKIGPTRDIHSERMTRGWANNPILLCGNRLYVAPTDSPYLVALDCDTGHELWTRVRNQYDVHDLVQEQERYLLGVQRDTLLVSGEGCLALDAATGAKRWSWHPDASDHILGRGACTRDHVYLPIRTKLVRLNADGSASSSFKWSDRDAGNLVIADNVLLSASPKGIYAFFSVDSIDKQVADQLLKNPDDPYLRYRVGQNHQKAGRSTEAGQCFEEAVRLAEKRGDRESRLVADNARLALYRLHMDLGRQAWDRNDRKASLDEFAQAKTWTKDDVSIVEIAFTVAELLAKAKANAEAVAELQGVIEKYPDVAFAKEGAREYAREHIDGILVAGGRTSYAPFEEQARAMLVAAARSDAADDYARLIQRYPNSVAAEDALMGLAQRLMQAGLFDDARQRLEMLLLYRQSERLPDAYRLLVLCHEQRGAWASARQALLQISRRFPTAKLAGPGGPVSAKDFVEERLRKPEYLQLTEAGHRRELGNSLHPAWTWSEPGSNEVKLLTPGGAMPREAADLVFVACKDSVRALRWNTGQEIWRAQVEHGVRASLFFDQTLIVCGTSKLFGLAVGTGKEQWRAGLEDGYVQEARISEGTLYLAAYQPSNRDSMRMMAMDAATGRELWTFPFHGDQSNTDGLNMADSCVIVPTSPKDLTILDREKGTPIGTIDLKSRFFRLLMPGPNRIVAMSARNSLSCFEISTGKLLWQQLTGPMLTESLVTNQGVIAFVERSEDGKPSSYLVVMDPETGKRRVRAVVSEKDFPYGIPGIDDQSAYITFRDRDARDRVFVSAFSLQTGARDWTCPREGKGSLQIFNPILNGPLFLLNGGIFEGVGQRWTPVTMVVRRSDGAFLTEIAPEPSSTGAPQMVAENGVFAVIQGSRIFAYIGE